MYVVSFCLFSISILLFSFYLFCFAFVLLCFFSLVFLAGCGSFRVVVLDLKPVPLDSSHNTWTAFLAKMDQDLLTGHMRVLIQ